MPLIATSVCFVFVAFLFWREMRQPDRVTISWAPFAWLFIAGTRFVSSWLNLRGPGGVDGYSEGSSIDRVIFLLLVLWGAAVLARRQISWGVLLRQNLWLTAYFAYCLLSITWSDLPDVSFKRLVKDLGNPIMALVMLTERSSYDAIVTTFRRLAFVTMPFSVIFIRYVPSLGRGYGFGGDAMYTGVSDHKNTLGLLCLAIGISYLWSYCHKRQLVNRYDAILTAILVYLFYLANSSTSLACLILASVLIVLSAWKRISRQPTRLMTATVVGAILYIASDALFDVQGTVYALLGRDVTLTNRTELWAFIRTLEVNPIVGTGFMNFWSGARMAAVWEKFGPGVNQAHSGYLEQYLNLGYIGVGFIGLIAVSALVRVRQVLQRDYAIGVLRLCIVVVALIYNYTEASFYGINIMWVLFLATAIDYPQAAAVARVQQKARVTASQSRFHTRRAGTPAFAAQRRAVGRR